jgi:hypothetical protein
MQATTVSTTRDKRDLNPTHSRFKGAPWYTGENIPVFVGGAGGIGSWLSLLLARAGFRPQVADFDTLELHNLSGQIYAKNQVRKKKVVALYDTIRMFADMNINVFDIHVDINTPVQPYTFSAFDNMKARYDLFRSWKNLHEENSSAIFIDGRLEAELLWIYCIRAADRQAVQAYTALLNTDTDAKIPEANCTFKQTSHTAAMIGAHMVGFFTNHITNVYEGAPIDVPNRFVPYEWHYNIPMNLVEEKATPNGNS